MYISYEYLLDFVYRKAILKIIFSEPGDIININLNYVHYFHESHSYILIDYLSMNDE